ncbi:MAG: hypothetical protein JWR25_2465 [Noviherbaspirillum sp.]|nr:hypothetical protein [Noviherbaspirillum sp.]
MYLPWSTYSEIVNDTPCSMTEKILSIEHAHPGNALKLTRGPFIGCAGWSLSAAVQKDFAIEGTHLERYAGVLPAVEINSSFYRPHRPDTYARWRDSVPDEFRFSVKVPKTITHELRLRNVDETLTRFLDEAGNLREKLGCLLVQLPPKLAFDRAAAQGFFGDLRMRTEVPVVCEPRHATWFSNEAAAVLAQAGVGFVRADPPAVRLPIPAVDAATVYIRLHGSPVIYRSVYSEEYLTRLHAEMTEMLGAGKHVWCIFDNTADGAAVPNALSLLRRFQTPRENIRLP